jgi:hypothetical protein
MYAELEIDSSLHIVDLFVSITQSRTNMDEQFQKCMGPRNLFISSDRYSMNYTYSTSWSLI